MSNNLNDKMDLIETYLDGTLDDAQKDQAEKEINADPDLQEELEYMKQAVSSVQRSALHTQVGNVATSYFSSVSENTSNKPTAKVYNMRFYALRIAAVLLIICISYTAMLYSISTPDKLFSEGFSDYDLPVSRGASKIAIIEQQYKLQNWQEVINIVKAENARAQKELFLAGMSDLKLNQPESAAIFFKRVSTLNQTAGATLFQDESEFYLALTYLKLNDVYNAKALLKSIQSNPAHIYNIQAKKISSIKLKMLEWKQ